ncbi:MAG TPA: hypothetical protein VFW87_24265 [Pirellulales bacterium]|nr:hypothetical protein [Pirellulales bacterium]
MNWPPDPRTIGQKLATLLRRGLITRAEYAENLLSSLSSYEVDLTVAEQLASAVLPEERPALITAATVVLEVDYRCPEPKFGGPGPGSARIAEMTEERTSRVRAWARALLPLLEGVD